jgi:hypothetical protein
LASGLDALLGLSWLASFVLNILAAIYCYRITRITGGFSAWWMVIIFTFLFAVRSFTSTEYGLLFSQVTGVTATSGLGSTALFNVALDLVMSVLLFGAMFDLHRIFKRQQKPTESAKSQ